uniref:Putative secreted peptide n=1 Tax=Anopheles braziliensis TaxID=58242 RepID=A0A2M3ZNF2_9DIPT
MLLHLPLPIHLLYGVQAFGLVVVPQQHRFLDLLPLVVHILQPAQKQSPIVPAACIPILLLLLGRYDVVHFFILQDRTDGEGKRLIGQCTGSTSMYAQNLLLDRQHQLLLLDNVLHLELVAFLFLRVKQILQRRGQRCRNLNVRFVRRFTGQCVRAAVH